MIRINLLNANKRLKGRVRSRHNRANHPERTSACVRNWRKRNPERLSAIKRAWREENPDKMAGYKRAWVDRNPDKTAGRIEAWIAANFEYAEEHRRTRRKTRPEHRLRCILRTRVNHALESRRRPGSAVRDLGCTVHQLKKHLEAQFAPGMTWENQGKWHVDHIKPLSSFDLTDREQFLKACHYTNLQPLWAVDNLKKGARR